MIYNILTGVAAFLLLDTYLQLVAPWIGSGLRGDPQVALVAFHTTFNVLGVLVVLPFAPAFARLIVWIVPEKGSATLQRLDDRLLADADAAIDATMQTLTDLTSVAFAALRRQLDAASEEEQPFNELREGLDATRAYLERIRTNPLSQESQSQESHLRHQESLHALDHLTRLTARLQEATPIEVLKQDERLQPLVVQIALALTGAATPRDVSSEDELERLVQVLRRRRDGFRERTIEIAARSEASGKIVLARLDAFRWLLRCTDHAWRITYHLRQVAWDPPAKASLL